MSVNGVSSSPLLARAILGDQTKVPIGAPVITNVKSRNSKDIQALITGTDLTEPTINQFEVFAEEGRSVKRDTEADALTYKDRINNNDKLIAEYAFDQATGSLVMVRRNKQVERVHGFLRQADYGVGPTGPRGDNGLDGRDGRDGKDGAEGDMGCEGEEGKPGETGSPGNEANPGPVGPTGPDGCEGTTGDRGVMGPAGRNGFEGARGPTGSSCPQDTLGPVGGKGVEFGKGVLFGLASMADPLVAIVGLDDDGIDAPAPICGWDGNSCPAPAPTPEDPEPVPPVVPPPEPAPPTSVPEVPPPQPEPAAQAKIQLCPVNQLPDPKYSCGSTVTSAYTTAWVQYDENKVPLGISMLPGAHQNTLAWPNSFVLCGTLNKGATYTFELTTPPGVASSLFIDCAIVAQTDYPGGTTRYTHVTTAHSSLRIRFLNNQERIPTWCGLKIYDATSGELLYFIGKNVMNAGISGEYSHMDLDPNWGGNAGAQHYH